MLELTKEECLELEKRVAEKVHQSFPEEAQGASLRLYDVISQVASRTTIITIREYEKALKQKQDS